MKNEIGTYVAGIITGILVTVVILTILIFRILHLGDDPAVRYTVAELTDAIATREANFAERAVELEGEK